MNKKLTNYIARGLGAVEVCEIKRTSGKRNIMYEITYLCSDGVKSTTTLSINEMLRLN